MTGEPKIPSFELTPFDLLKASLADFVEEGLPHYTIINLLFLADDEIQFFTGMQAATELKDIVLDHYDTEREPDDYPFEEADDEDYDDPDDPDFEGN